VAGELENLNDPWLVAVWPGMGSVAMLAGSHLAASLEAEVEMELPAEEFFEVQHVEVEDGLAAAGRLPRNLVLLWRDPDERRDLIIFIGESQPAQHGYRLCQQIAAYARQWNVQRITTFAAMATQLHPANDADVFAVTTNEQLADACRANGLNLLKQGQVSGLNGLMLAAAEEVAIPAMCLMGEMPYFAVNLPNPPAALAALGAFSQMSGIDFDLHALQEQSEQVRDQLKQLVDRLNASAEQSDEENEFGFTTPDLSWHAEEPPESSEETAEKSNQPPLDPETRQRIESLFEQVRQDRSKAVKLKRELDRHGVFKQYEDRFLDLFRKGG
jgi:proteasome assembly chaperone (PAC2) family protein